ncbi:MAG: hypothetical protein DI626_06195 [Micavibrio aeruginosavorus]|uniref:Uncharacterized protein n=1 Tax=Micavibrio aeruginosavorus TaxID=349221 RepID=A0A2W4ZYU8_9BACT|nr:MAG: hypothetical protein DI626_06195 [Micavibrio aeruginosavorus]
MFTQTERRKTQGGNVLFLILIAVALFAALSYVVTQSTRSGGGSTEREKNILSSAQMTQYPTALRTAIVRMVLGGAPVEQIKFDAPGSAAFSTTSTRLLVFHPQGGGSTYQEAPPELSADGVALQWHYNADFSVPGVGIDTAGGNDIVAFLPGVSQGVCNQVNEQLGVGLGTCTPDVAGGTVPQINTSIVYTNFEKDMTSGGSYTFPASGTALQCQSGTSLTRKASGCFYHNGQKKYVFYSVLLER